MSMSPFESHLVVTDSRHSAAELLAFETKLSVGALKQAMQKGCVWHTRKKHTQRLRRNKKALHAGDELHLYYNEDVLQATTDDAVLMADEQQFSVWYKPYGMLCQGSKWSDHTTINRFAQTTLTPQRPAFIVHRLDRATTGLMVLAHSKTAARELSAAFEKRQTRKTYQAIVHGDLSSLSEPLTINTEVNNKSAISHVTCLEFNAELQLSKIEIAIETGRKHQIRIHMASMQHPIVGDRLHGNTELDARLQAKQDRLCDLQLQAVTLSFPDHRTGNQLSYQLPESFRLTF